MQGKVVVITGGTSGIGQVAAERLAAMGARIVLLARSKSRGEAALDRLRELASSQAHRVHYGDVSRLADLDRDHQALALPIEVLRQLTEQYLGSLSAEVQAEIRRRLQRAAKDEPPPH